jgi:hypothetical protein
MLKFIETKKLILDGNTVQLTEMEGVETSSTVADSEDEARQLWKSTAKSINENPELRLECQAENTWTIFEKAGQIGQQEIVIQ